MRFSACYVNTSYTSKWLQRRGFRDDDGMGEELSKNLLDEADEGSEESGEFGDGVIQCKGTTQRGERCRLTSEHYYDNAAPLREGEHFCELHKDQEWASQND